MKFTADDNVIGSSFFSAEIGLRPFNVTDDDDDDEEDDDDDDDVPFYPKDVIPISKEITFNEKVVMFVFYFAICVMCCKNKYCMDGCYYKCFACCIRQKRELDDVEIDFNLKVRTKKLGFDVNMSIDADEGIEFQEET